MESSLGGGAVVTQRQYKVRRYNQRMARRIARRAKLGEEGVAVAFAFNNLLTTCLIGVTADILRYVPYIGDLIEIAFSLVAFYFHRIVLVTEQNVYVYRDLPFHYPAKRLASYPRGSGVVHLGTPNPYSGISAFIRRGQLNFADGLVVYHGFIWIKRARYIEQEANLPAGS